MLNNLLNSPNQRQIYLLGANLLFIIHFSIVLSITFGWLIPGYFYIFLSVLVAAIISELYFGYCVLTKLEFSIRKRMDPTKIFHSSFIKHYAFNFFKIGKAAQALSLPTKAKNYSFLLLLLTFLAIGLTFRFLVVN